MGEQGKPEGKTFCGKLPLLIGLLLVLAAGGFCLVTTILLPARDDSRADAMLEQSEYDAAIALLEKPGDYRDARERCLALWRQMAPYRTLDAKYLHSAALLDAGGVVATGNNRWGQCEVSD